MTEETRQEGQETAGEQTAVITTDEAAASSLGPKKLRQSVEIKDAGPCRKHVKVSVERDDIDERMSEHFSKLVVDSYVPGFRPGKTPRRLIEKRYRKDVTDQVKSEVLLASLEQLGKDHDIAPLSPPNLQIDKIVIPTAGPLVYEFDVEVRPQFDLPPYKGMKLKRPVKTMTDEDIAELRRRYLNPYGQIVPKETGVVEIGDILVGSVEIKDGEQLIGKIDESNFRVERQLAFKDGLARKFGETVKGAKIGDSRVVDIELSSQAAGGLGGRQVKGTFTVKDIKTVRLPELTEEFFESTPDLGVSNAAQLEEVLRILLERNIEHTQRRSARMQVMEQISAAATWQLPQDLLMRQARKAVSRRIMEMRGDGMTDAQIEQQIRLMQQDILKSTEMALKEHFVLQKIAEEEKIEVNDNDIEDEIYRLAEQSGESPRKVRARIEKEDMLDALAAEMIERQALDLILKSAEYEEVPLEPQEQEAPMATHESQAVPGEMSNPETSAAETPPQS
ncbi:MAG: trigger factor [Planctomycetia bacterium]|nr:trigger factor [Planctomycetia bacterium]